MAAIAGTRNLQHRQVGTRKGSLEANGIAMQVTNERFRAAVPVELSTRPRCYPPEAPRDCWYACADCAALIGNEAWDDLIARIVAAYEALQPIPEDEQVVFRQELENHLKAFHTFYLHVM